MLYCYQADTINISPASQNITAGFERYFSVRGQDNFGTNFTFVPETVSITNGIGAFEKHMTGGILFQATKTAVGTLDAGFGIESASANITVFNGALDRIAILDENSKPIDGTIPIKEGHYYQFDGIGYDVYGNTIYVIPQWDANPWVGIIYQDALLYTLDGSGFGTVTAELGSITAAQWIQVVDRHWLQKGGSLNVDTSQSTVDPSLTVNGSIPYVAWKEHNGTGDQIYVKHWNGSSWVQDGGSLNVDTSQNALATSLGFNGSTPYVAWQEDDGTAYQIYVKHWNGSSWVQDGGSLNVDTLQYVHRPSLAFNGSTPYVAWYEYDDTALQIYVKTFE